MNRGKFWRKPSGKHEQNTTKNLETWVKKLLENQENLKKTFGMEKLWHIFFGVGLSLDYSQKPI